MSRLKRQRFLEAYAHLGNITVAATQAGIDRRSVQRWRKTDEAFTAQCADAADESADHLEAEARRRAVEGVEEPVFHKGEQIATVRKYSDLLLIFLLKGIRPEKYRERFEHMGPGGAPLELVKVYVPANHRDA